MFRFLIFIVFFFVSAFCFAQHVKKKAATIPYKYIYSTTKEQAWKLYAHNYKDVYTKLFLNAPLDSFTVLEEPPLKYYKGGNIYLSPREDYLYTRFLTSRAISVHTIQTPAELGIVMQNTKNSSLLDIQFYTQKGKVELIHNGYYFVVPKELYGKPLMVEYGDEFLIIELDKTLNKRKYLNSIASEKGYGDCIFIDKPKYHKGDTVFVKGYFSTSIFFKKALLQIYWRDRNNNMIKVLRRKIRKDKNQSLSSYFILPDSLPMDTKYTVSISHRGKSPSTSFDIEDYYLNDFLLQADARLNKQYQDSLTLLFQYTTPQGEPIRSGWIYFTIQPESIKLDQLKDSYVPYLILRDSIQAAGQEVYTYKARMPELPYGEYGMNLTMQVNNNGLTEEIKTTFSYSFQPVVLHHTLNGHVCEFNAYAVDTAIATGFALYGSQSSYYDTVAISFPYQVNLQEQKLPSVFLLNTYGVSLLEQDIIKNPIAFSYSIQEKQVALQIKNPFQFDISVKDRMGKSFYQNNAPEITLVLPIEKDQLYFCEYIMGGNYYQKRLLISPDVKSLLIEASIPDTIQPGGFVNANVHVGNVRGKAFRNVNLTALAIDDRLGHSSIPSPEEMIQYELNDVVNENYNYVNVLSSTDTSILKQVYVDYNRFLSEDSINYFLVPVTSDSLTQAFLYVYKNKRYMRPGYVFEGGKPVYWSDVTSSKQSFYTTAGFHSYEIRLPNETIFIDSIFIYPSFKNNILIPIERISASRYRSVSRPKRLVAAEIKTLESYLYEINAAVSFDLQTKTNYYSSISRTANIINADSNFYIISDSANIAITKSVSGKSKKSTYLKRQRFRVVKNKSEISMSELQSLERRNVVFENQVITHYPISISVSKPTKEASLYIQYEFPYKTIFKLIDSAHVERIDSVAISRSHYYSDSETERMDVSTGVYRLQVFNYRGELLVEKIISIDAPGIYFTNVFIETERIIKKDENPTDLYSNGPVDYPLITMYYQPVYNSYYRKRNRSRRVYPYNYGSVFGGLNAMYTGASKLSYGYQVGAIVGKQITKYVRGEVRFSYGETALTLQQSNSSLYSNSYGKVGLMAWYSPFDCGRNRFGVLFGSGVSGQYMFEKPIGHAALVIPVGVSLKYRFPYTESVNLEVLWNKPILGTDYSYSNNGVWEVNLRLNFRFRTRRCRVICPSNFWGASGSSNSLLERSKTSSAHKSPVPSTVNKPAQNTTTISYEVVRSNFYDRAYWVPSFKTDKNGNATFRASYPDALTKWNNYIIANKKYKSNTWHSQTTTYLPNYIQLYVPRFVIQGDSATASYHVQSDTAFVIQNSVNNVDVSKSMLSDAGYSFYASQQWDTVTCKSMLRINNKQIDGEQRKIPVYLAGNETYTGTYAYLKGDTAFTLHKSDSAIQTKIYLSNNVHDFVRMQYTQLMDYKYACNEQTASKLIGALEGKKLNGSYGGKQPSNFCHTLKKNMNWNGMYGWWGNSNTNITMSAYVFYALNLYYEHAGINKDKFYTNLSEHLVDLAYYNKVDYFTYWLMKEAKMPMNDILLQNPAPKTYKEEILALRIRQLNGDTITRTEIEKYLNQTIIGNYALRRSNSFEANWYENELLYLIVLHKIAKANFPDIADNISKGLIEHGSLSEYAPTFVKALFINEFTNINTDKAATFVGAFDTTAIRSLPFVKEITDSLNHSFTIRDAKGMYVVTSEKQIRTTDIRYEGLKIDYTFEENGTPVTSLHNGTLVDQVVHLTLSKSCSYVMVEIPMAAGCMLEDIHVSCPEFLTHREVFRDKIILYFNQLPEGLYTFTIRQKVLFKGNYQLNPCSVNLMYFPMIQTQTALRRIKID